VRGWPSQYAFTRATKRWLTYFSSHAPQHVPKKPVVVQSASVVHASSIGGNAGDDADGDGGSSTRAVSFASRVAHATKSTAKTSDTSFPMRPHGIIAVPWRS